MSIQAASEEFWSSEIPALRSKSTTAIAPECAMAKGTVGLAAVSLLNTGSEEDFRALVDALVERIGRGSPDVDVEDFVHSGSGGTQKFGSFEFEISFSWPDVGFGGTAHFRPQPPSYFSEFRVPGGGGAPEVWAKRIVEGFRHAAQAAINVSAVPIPPGQVGVWS